MKRPVLSPKTRALPDGRRGRRCLRRLVRPPVRSLRTTVCLAELLLLPRGDAEPADANVDAAAKLYEEALDGQSKAFGPEHPQTLRTVAALADVSERKDDLRAAEPLYRRALAGMEASLGSNHPETLNTMSGLARVLRASGDLDGAQELYQKGIHASLRATGTRRDESDTTKSSKSINEAWLNKGGGPAVRGR